ncbi:MAG TPA: hypothetical protein VHB98_18510, partial [Chloroflexota bacterium]|nr:hypothetical protein [Chloroflexota bacterium]
MPPLIRRVLVLNTGSSSLKWTMLDVATGAIEAQDDESWHGADGTDRHTAAIKRALERVPHFDAAGHRVVHGGPIFREAVLVDGAVRKAIADLAELAPLHNPAALAGIDVVAQARPD